MMKWKEAVENSPIDQAVRRDTGGGLIFRFVGGFGLTHIKGSVRGASRAELEGHEDWFPAVQCDVGA